MAASYNGEVDRLSFLIKETEKIRQDIAKIDERLNDFESRMDFDPNDIRYSRHLEDKKILLPHLCELRRLVVAMRDSCVEVLSVPNKRLRSSSPPPPRPVPQVAVEDTVVVPTNHPEGEKNIPAPSESDESGGFIIDRSGKMEAEILTAAPSQESAPDKAIAAAAASDDNTNKNEHTTLPTLQMEEYLSTKMKLAQIMRDFNDKKICFIGTDDSKVLIQQYHTISSRVKLGEDISQYLKGKLVLFVTGIDKKKKSITETKLFIPDYEVCVGYK